MTVREIRLLIKDLINENKTETSEIVTINNKLIAYYTKKIDDIATKVYAQYGM